MRAIEVDYQQNKDAVIEMLIDNVIHVDLSIPRVVKGNFEDTEW